MHTYIHTHIHTNICTYIHIVTLITISLSLVGEEGGLGERRLFSGATSEVDKWLHSSLNTGTTHLEQHNSPSRAYALSDNFYYNNQIQMNYTVL